MEPSWVVPGGDGQPGEEEADFIGDISAGPRGGATIAAD